MAIPRASSVLGSLTLGLSGLGWPYAPGSLFGSANVPMGEFVSNAEANHHPFYDGSVSQPIGEFVCSATGTAYRAFYASSAATFGEFAASAAGTITTPYVSGSAATRFGEFSTYAAGTYVGPSAGGGSGGGGSGSGFGGGYAPAEVYVTLHIVGGGFAIVNESRQFFPIKSGFGGESRTMSGLDVDGNPYDAIGSTIQCGWTLPMDVITERWLRMPSEAVIVTGTRKKRTVY